MVLSAALVAARPCSAARHAPDRSLDRRRPSQQVAVACQPNRSFQKELGQMSIMDLYSACGVSFLFSSLLSRGARLPTRELEHGENTTVGSYINLPAQGKFDIGSGRQDQIYVGQLYCFFFLCSYHERCCDEESELNTSPWTCVLICIIYLILCLLPKSRGFYGAILFETTDSFESFISNVVIHVDKGKVKFSVWVMQRANNIVPPNFGYSTKCSYVRLTCVFCYLTCDDD